MHDLLTILSAATELFARGETATLATVVRVQGSSYRMPGARMLVDAAGRRFGSVSGGCLEADVARRGRLLSAENPHCLVRYDGSDEDAAWGFGLGCQGSIDVFIERLDQMPASLSFIKECFDTRTVGSMATLFEVEGKFGLPIGFRLMAPLEHANQSGDELLLREDAIRCLEERKAVTVTYETAEGVGHALVEPIQPPLPLIIFGAGHDTVPLVRAAKSLGWHVTVWDRRAGYARADRFPEADVVTSIDPKHIEISNDTAAIVMTHHYPDDSTLVPMLLNSPARYVGALGPRSRTDRILAASSTDLSSAQLERLHAPIGLDIGAEGPEQVALAVIAEILAVFSDRPGVPLRHRTGSIHPPSASRIVRVNASRTSEEVRA